MAKKKTEKRPVDTKKLNETGRRAQEERRLAESAVNTDDRRKSQRRRHIDPTTCERDYSELEIEFMRALDAYKQASGRMFPTCSEILEVLLKLGYRKQPEFAGEASAPVVALDNNLFMDSSANAMS